MISLRFGSKFKAHYKFVFQFFTSFNFFYSFLQVFDPYQANPDANKFTPSDLAVSVKEKFNKKIGLVLDLTFTSR